MDTSVEYILMCEKATEIQPTVKPRLPFETGLHITNKEVTHQYGAIECDFWFQQTYPKPFIDSKNGNVKITWLPRQDQLQCIGKKENDPDFTVGAVKLLMEWIYKNKHYAMDCETREQLELAYVMDAQYDKVWNGEQWVKNQ